MKHIFIWFSEALSHHLTVWLLKQTNRKGYTKGLFLCGPPRCGTSWISDVLSFYYNLPRPKHYKLPLWFDAMVHTHTILGKDYTDQAYYASRYGLDAYFSRYLQIKNDIVNGQRFVGEKKYTKVFRDVKLESNDSYNVRALLDLDLNERKGLIYSLAEIRFLERDNKAVVINYDEAVKNPEEVFAKAIESFSGDVNKDRLSHVLSLLNKGEQKKLSPERRSTLINKQSSDSRARLETSVVEYYEDRFAEIVNSFKK